MQIACGHRNCSRGRQRSISALYQSDTMMTKPSSSAMRITSPTWHIRPYVVAQMAAHAGTPPMTCRAWC